MNTFIRFIERRLPTAVYSWLVKQKKCLANWPFVGFVRFGKLRQLTPISRVFGLNRGQSIDRYYIERFLNTHALEIHGHVLEIADNKYTCKFGGSHVTKSDVLHVLENNPQATIVADLTHADNISTNTFDCIICTQTLQFIYDVRSAICTLNRILKPGGILLVTVPGISQISQYDMDRWGEYWRFTTLSAKYLFEEIFGKSNVSVQAYGNVLVASSFLYGLAAEELTLKELNYNDQDYEMLISIRAVKSARHSKIASV